MKALITWLLSMLFAPPWVEPPPVREDWRGLPPPNWACRRWGVDYL